MGSKQNQFDSGNSSVKTRIEELLQILPRDLATPTDLWPRIAASIEDPTENAFRLLHRDVENTRDFWPAIEPRLDADRSLGGRPKIKITPRRFSLVAAVGMIATLALTALVTLQFRLLSENPGIYGTAGTTAAYAAAASLPPRVNSLFDRFENALPGTQAAAVKETAFEIRRDLIMTRFERLRIERAMAVSSNERNLRTQWRHAYVTELRLINAAENLSNFQFNRRAI